MLVIFFLLFFFSFDRLTLWSGSGSGASDHSMMGKELRSTAISWRNRLVVSKSTLVSLGTESFVCWSRLNASDAGRRMVRDNMGVGSIRFVWEDGEVCQAWCCLAAEHSFDPHQLPMHDCCFLMLGSFYIPRQASLFVHHYLCVNTNLCQTARVVFGRTWFCLLFFEVRIPFSDRSTSFCSVKTVALFLSLFMQIGNEFAFPSWNVIIVKISKPKQRQER